MSSTSVPRRGSPHRTQAVALRSLLALLCGLFLGAPASASRRPYLLAPVPAEVASAHFRVTVDGVSSPVVHAAANYYLLSFPVAKKPLKITVTADQPDFWKHGVEVQPWRLGIRPTVEGSSISFTLRGPAQISITRPHEFLAGAEMLFLFADPKEADAPLGPAPGLRYFGPGVHRENIDAHSGDRIYFAPGAFLFGSLNVWQVKNVRVWGRGTIIYDGPQDPNDDEGWMHKPNWHCIVMDNASDVSIEGLTCIVRSRTWMIQMKDSHRIAYRNIKVIGGSNGNANQDGMDWLGGGDTVVEDSFFRAADDIFAMQGNWEGYTPEAMAIRGANVQNIQIRRTTLSTSISNVVRAAWPHKSFNSANFSLTDSDVLHAGLGGCVVPFGLLEIWADPDGTGLHRDYTLQNVRLEDWYSLVQLRQQANGIDGVHLDGIFALEQPSLVPSTISGDVRDVTLSNVVLAGSQVRSADQVPLLATDGAAPASVSPPATIVDFTFPSGLHPAGQKVRFEADVPQGLDLAKLEWTFGDGATGHGRSPRHRFKDIAGTANDGSGRFRVLLHAVTRSGAESWIAHPYIVSDTLHATAPQGPQLPGLQVRTEPQPAPGVAAVASTRVAPPAISAQFTATQRPQRENYAMHFDGFLRVPADGGYSFMVVANDSASLSIDGVPIATSPKPWPQVCGLRGNAAQAAQGTISLQAGLHAVHLDVTHSVGEDDLAVYWQASGQPLTPIPASALSHAADTAAQGRP